MSDKSFRELGLQRKIRENACPLNVHLRQLWEPASGGGSGGAHVPCSVLNVDVPEFYPKVHQPPQDLYLPENAVNEPGVGAGTLSSAWRTSCLYEPWLTYGYPVRAHEFRGLDSLVDGLRLLPSPPSHAPLPAPARRLYSAVLQNSPPSSTGAPAAVDEDELERQAMEQYRRSEETIAQQYQVWGRGRTYVARDTASRLRRPCCRSWSGSPRSSTTAAAVVKRVHRETGRAPGVESRHAPRGPPIQAPSTSRPWRRTSSSTCCSPSPSSGSCAWAPGSVTYDNTFLLSFHYNLFLVCIFIQHLFTYLSC